MIKFIKKILPSSKLKKDIFIKYNKYADIKPIPLDNLSLTFIMKKKILQLRKKNSELTIQRELKKLTLVIPYRHRKEHLDKFIPTIKNYLKKQNIDFEIIVVEQDDENVFNKAKLMNIGAINASSESEYFVFHDVDLLPENIDYRYCNYTLKLFNFIEENGVNKEYGETIFGGATLVPKEIFYKINGFSNNYWQWGKEDDDFLLRHLLMGFIPLYDMSGQFIALPHPPSITRDSSGKYVSKEEILKQNQILYKKNKSTFSNLKRGISHQDKDGITTIDNYTIVSDTQENDIRVIKVKFLV